MNWRYYSKAVVPDCQPHEVVDTTDVKNGKVWKIGGGVPLFATWITDFDCGYETDWWYVIKDEVFDASTLKAKRRYEITKGTRNFEVREIKAKEYVNELYEVLMAAFEGYPEKYRPTHYNPEFFYNLCQNIEGIFLGAFLKDEEGNPTDKLCGYAHIQYFGKHIKFRALKAIPEYEKCGANAALTNGILLYCAEDLAKGCYICDGQRSLNHETAFQDYLEKYFGFRKAYCNLHMVYRPAIRWLIPILRVFRKILKKMNNIGVVHSINAVLGMDEICRKCKKQALNKQR